MLKGFVRLAACAASGAAFLALTGCGGAAPDDGYAGPPPSSYDRPATPPTLMGSAPAKPAADGLAGGPRGAAPAAAAAGSTAPRFQLITRRKPDGTLQISMRPIANPEDMSPAERRQVYGNRYAPRAVAAKPRRTWRAAPAAPKAAVKPVVTARAAPAPAVKPAPKSVAAVPLKPAAPAPVIAAAPVAPVAPAAPKLNPTQQLQAAVSPAINRGASLSVPADLKAGKEADVVLSLPGDLLAMVQEQAAKLGLGKAARKVNAYANLQGQGYEISPPGQQTAPVAAGKPTSFTWKVKPTAAEKSPLKADYGLELNGAKPQTAFSVGSVEEFVAAPVEAAKDAARGFKFDLSWLKALAPSWVPEPVVPGVGKVAREKVVGALLALLALILLIVVANGASASRARNERRRKFRTMQDYGVNEPEHDAHNTAYVNPMLAAAAGGAGGYALASHGHDDAGHGNDDHGHGNDGHGQGHDDHATGHDGHGHGDHGHGHDGHGAGHTAALTSQGHDDHGHGQDDHGQDDHGHGHDDHGDGAQPHGPAQHIANTPVSGHDDHGHGHDDDGHGNDDHGHGHDDQHGHDDHHKEPEHAH